MNNDSLDRSLSAYVRKSNTYSTRRSDDDDQAGLIKDFIAHVRGIVPLLEHVKDSISESSNRIPKASMQLSKVTEATESATVEILNVLEAMTEKISASQGHLKTISQFVTGVASDAGREEALSAIASINRVLTETKDDSMNIAVALQVQDITSQQIAGVSHTIESIRLQLAEALDRFDKPEDDGSAIPTKAKGSSDKGSGSTHFDGDADFSKKPDRQDMADEIVKQWAGKNSPQ